VVSRARFSTSSFPNSWIFLYKGKFTSGHEVRRLSAQKHKKKLDAEKKEKKKNIAWQGLERRRAKARHERKPEEDSPKKEDEDDDNNDGEDVEGMAACLDCLLQPPPRANVSWM
jgi:hypothetical protein